MYYCTDVAASTPTIHKSPLLLHLLPLVHRHPLHYQSNYRRSHPPRRLHTHRAGLHLHLLMVLDQRDYLPRISFIMREKVDISDFTRSTFNDAGYSPLLYLAVSSNLDSFSALPLSSLFLAFLLLPSCINSTNLLEKPLSAM